MGILVWVGRYYTVFLPTQTFRFRWAGFCRFYDQINFPFRWEEFASTSAATPPKKTKKQKKSHRFPPVFITFSYLNTRSLNCASFSSEDFSTSACRLLPWESMVTTAVNPSTLRCHIASGIPNSIKSTPSTPLIQSA
ncbi:hypothetical protein FIU87_04395 [Bacillus sp. THAF10]|nr:hypothetical protein FIU87_04395 [Bacillus sp. THAF10]